MALPADWDVGIAFVSERDIAAINGQYRGRAGATDVLSFAYHAVETPGTLPEVQHGCDKNLGDIVVCPTYVARLAHADDAAFAARLPEVIVHGVCHLLGYTHDTDAAAEAMQRAESAALRNYAAISGAAHLQLEALTARRSW